MLAIFENTSKENQLKIINSHPDLARKTKISLLTSDSQKEQSNVGLNHCSEEEFNEFKDLNKYFSRSLLNMLVKKPFETINNNNFNVNVSVKGGGLSGQAGALRHGISKALSLYDNSLRPVLKKVGFLTRDSRVVERKKFGLAKARRSYQFSKR